MVVLASVILVPLGAGARVVEVPGTYGTIYAACSHAVAGDTIAIHPGTYYESNLMVRAGVTVLGMGSDSSAVKFIGLTGFVFEVQYGNEQVVLENVEIQGAGADWTPILWSHCEELLVQRCLLRRISGPGQYAALIGFSSGDATVRRSHLDFGGGGIWQWVFDAGSRAGHFVVQDCVIEVDEPWIFMGFSPSQSGTVYEFSNNTILCLLNPSTSPLDYSLYLVNNIIGQVLTGSPGSEPEVFELRYNCFMWEWLPEARRYEIGNFIADPLFCDSLAGDYRLEPESPCRGTGEGGEDIGARLGLCGWAGVTAHPAESDAGRWLAGPWPNPTAGGVSLLMQSAAGC